MEAPFKDLFDEQLYISLRGIHPRDFDHCEAELAGILTRLSQSRDPDARTFASYKAQAYRERNPEAAWVPRLLGKLALDEQASVRASIDPAFDLQPARRILHIRKWP
jgi:hypothetical protein